jgi:hypothetical protein
MIKPDKRKKNVTPKFPWESKGSRKDNFGKAELICGLK